MSALRDFGAVSEAANRLETPLEQFKDLTRDKDRQADFRADVLGAVHRIMKNNEP